MRCGSYARRPAHELCASSARNPAHEFLCSRKLRLAPQDYSPWTPPVDRLSGRSSTSRFATRSRAAESLDALDLSRILYPRVPDLVGSTLEERAGDAKSPGHVRLPRMRASYGPKS